MGDLEAAPDLAVCDREPITRLERIQPFGFLLAMTRNWTVARASENLSNFLGIEASAAIGASLDDILDRQTLHDIRNRMAFLGSGHGSERLYGLTLVAGRPPFDISVHYANSMIVLEGEPTGVEDRTDAASLVRAMVARLATQKTLEDFHRDAARQIRVLTGFDRVMVYRFDESGAGEVIAEAATNGMDTFLGLHYPGSDIPVQARALYLRNAFRIIADVGAETVLLTPTGPGIEPLDQSLAFTRAVSPVHIEYLQNMNVAASLSVSIVVDGALWGLIACHNRVPRLPNFVVRTAAELFGQMYSMKLERRLRRADSDLDRLTLALVDHASESIGQDELLLGDAAWWQDSVSELIGCDGVVVALHGELSSIGSVPPRGALEVLVQRLNSRGSNGVFDTGHLASLYPEAVLHAEKAAGMLAIPISDVPRDYILLFRRERLHATTWAGNPQKAVALADDGLRLSPRKSFAAFTSISHGRSLPFTDENRRTARALRAALVELTLGFSRYREETHVKTVQRQELLIAELNHRIRNIIGLIRGLISQSGIHTDKVSEYVQSLDGRIQSLARAHDQITRENWNPARVSELLDREISAYVPEQLERFTRLGPEVLVRPQAFSTLSLVVHELVTNAAKYGSLSRHGSVAVTTEIRAGLGLYINWREIDGPPVQAPRRRGFGSVILERLVPFDLGGTAQIRYEPGGLEADFFIPSAHIVEAAALMGSDGGQSDLAPVVSVDQPHNRPLEGMSVLLLEDNLILALETEDLLHHFGAKVVFLASSIDAASQILKSQRLDFALLDLYIGAHTSLEFALSVRASQIPFIFATGYGENADLSLFHPPPAIVTKPYGRLVANSVIAQVLRARPMRRSGDATDQEAPLSSDEAVRHDNSGK